MKTYSLREKDFDKRWRVVDASEQPLGRIATQISIALRGKDKPIYTPNLDMGDFVIVINAAKVKLTGKKWTDKIYNHHTGYIGGIKSATALEMLAKAPDRIVSIAIKGMLPKNKLGRLIGGSLRVYAGAEHGQEAQKPEPMKPRLAR